MAYAENASSWIGTLLGDIIKAPEGGEKEVRQRERTRGVLSWNC